MAEWWVETMNLRTIVALASGLLLTCSGAFAQQGGAQDGSKAVWTYARGGAVSARRPGLMVQRGIQRYNNAQNEIIARARRGPIITDTPADRPTKIVNQAKAEAIRIIFQNLTALIVAFNFQQQIDAGRPPDSGTAPPSTDLTDLLGGPISGSGG